jgi:hypothetical protein
MEGFSCESEQDQDELVIVLMRKTMRKFRFLLDMKTQGLDGAIVISIAQQCKRGRWNEFCTRKVEGVGIRINDGEDQL